MTADEIILIAINIALIGLALGTGLLVLAVVSIRKPSLSRDDLDRMGLS